MAGPVSPMLTGAAISGAAGLGGSILDSILSAINAKKQRAHDKEMAGINYDYAINQMNHSNKLAVEQWERENEYNDPSAVRQRYEAAGINPAAAFGQGAASGAGIAGGLSGGSSGGAMGHSSNTMFSTNFGGLGQDIIAGYRADAQNMADKARAEADRAKAKSDWLEVRRKEALYTDDFLSSELAAALNKNDREKYDTALSRLKFLREENLSSYYDVMNAATMRERVAAAQLAEDRLKEQEQIIENLRKDGIIKDEMANKVRAEVKTEGAEFEVKMAQARQFRELANLAVKDQELRGEQIRKVTHDIIQGYISAGADAISAITDIVSVLTPVLGLSKAKRTATRVVTEEYDKNGKLKGKKVTRNDEHTGYTDVPQ